MYSVDEGKRSYHDYKLLKIAPDDAQAEDIITIDGIDYVLVDSVESLKYKVSDGVSDLVAWISIPLNAEGTIEIPGPINRIDNPDRIKRYLILFATHDGGNHLPEEIEYVISKKVGIDSSTTPL